VKAALTRLKAIKAMRDRLTKKENIRDQLVKTKIFIEMDNLYLDEFF
jgi:hypothetical protein